MAKSKSETVKEPPDIVIAVDFGTTGTGFAYQLRTDFNSNKQTIYENKDWGDGNEHFKTPTYLLLNPDRKDRHIHEENTQSYFGYEAEDMYAGLQKNERNHWYFFKRFKMQLCSSERIDTDYEVKDVRGKSLKAHFVFGHALQCIKKMALRYLRDSDQTYAEMNVQWVLTVPAIWSDGAKSLMRMAAKKADIEETMLTIALEPEAAAIYYAISDANPPDYSKRDCERNLCVGPGTANIVVDMGGGTVDVTTIQVKDNGVIEQVFETRGSAAGGDKVNEEISSLISKWLGSGHWEKFKDECPYDFIVFERSIEQAKCNLKSRKPAERLLDNFHLSIPRKVLKKLEGEHKTLQDAIKTTASNIKELKGRMQLNNGRLCLENDVLREIMEIVVEEIMQHIFEIIRYVTSEFKIEGIVLVGGFAKSHFVYDYMKRSLEEKRIPCPLRRPLYCQPAVLRGAVLFGHDERILRKRVLRMTYGIGSYKPYEEGMNFPDARKVIKNGETYIENYFYKHARRGQSVNIDDWTPYKTYDPIYDSQTSMLLPIYSSSDKEPMYTDDKSCVKIGAIDVKFDSRLSQHKTRRVAFNFGRTEIIVRAYSTDTGDEDIFHLSNL